jgi:hypothetical protein
VAIRSRVDSGSRRGGGAVTTPVRRTPTPGQYDVLRWIADGCPGVEHDISGRRVSARALHDRGLVRVSGRGATWTAKVTDEGAKALAAEKDRVEAELEKRRLEAEKAEAERLRQADELREARELLRATVAGGGRFEVGLNFTVGELSTLINRLAAAGEMPAGQVLTHEPVMMDPVLGHALYLEPDFVALTALTAVVVPRQLRSPHAAVTTFLDKRKNVSKASIPRAARILQALVTAAEGKGWTVKAYKPPYVEPGRDGDAFDLTILTSRRECAVGIRELDERGRKCRTAPFAHSWEPLGPGRQMANRDFQPSGALDLSVTFERHEAIQIWGDIDGAHLEDQLPQVVKAFEVHIAQLQWKEQEDKRRRELAEVRWRQVRANAIEQVGYDRHAAQLQDELERHDKAEQMRLYARAVASKAAALDGQIRADANSWAAWVSEHADTVDPLNHPLTAKPVSGITYAELEAHMPGWSAYGPHRK